MQSAKKRLDNRGVVIRALFVIVAVLLLGKAAQLQIFETEWNERANRVGSSKVKLYPARGLMADRNGELLTINEPMYQIEMTYRSFAKNNANFDTLGFCNLLNITPEYFVECIPKKWGFKYTKRKPFIFLPNVSRQMYATFQENLFRFSGFSASLRSSRGYPQPVAAHLLGYMSEVDQKAIETGDGRYVTGDYHGLSGLEYQYESMLRGEKGEKWLYLDRLGRDVGNVKAEQDAIVGANLVTTIDLQLQQYGESLMVNKVGTVIAIEPATGEILSMISAPTYDPNWLRIGRGRSQAFTQLQRDTLQPLLNRAINGKYAPGSPFKTLVSLIGLETGTLTPDRGMVCNGGFTSGGKVLLGCHAHGYINNVEEAIAQSCNNYFVTAWLENINRFGSETPVKGIDAFNDYLSQFGLGQKLGIDFPGEISGFIPGSEFINKSEKGERWKAIYYRALAIGQGQYEMTSLQIANFIAAIANRGHWFTPHLIRQVQEGNDAVTRPLTPERHDIDIDRQHFETVVRGMRQTVLNGTARRANIPNVEICGKTGTVQNPNGDDHSVFTAFAPQNNPQIAILVYIENGGYGGTIAAPIASLMVERYLNGSIAKNRKYLEQRMFDTDMTKRGETTIREVK
ncbi:MAG: penicillin-binding protein 2 [Neolewinella sp.]|jgi:penicillin-binding protein 2